MEFFASSNGIPVHISDSGKGDKVLLFLHGYLETLYIWEEFVEILPKDYRVILIDLPGHGLSSSHPDANDMKFCSEVVVGVLDYCKVDTCIVLGHSMGGYIAQACIKNFPARFDAIIHFNSNPYADDPEKKKDRLREISFIESGKLMSLASISIPNMYFKDNLRRMDEKIAETIEICETHDPLGICASIRGLMVREDNLELLSATQKPILFIFGDSDSYLTVEKAETILNKLPNSKGVFVAGTGHNSFLEEPKSTLNGVLNFIESL